MKMLREYRTFENVIDYISNSNLYLNLLSLLYERYISISKTITTVKWKQTIKYIKKYMKKERDAQRGNMLFICYG